MAPMKPMVVEDWSTGLPGLDEILQGLRPGDNVVWKMGDIADFQPLVEPFYRHAIATGRPLVYFRFGKHDPLVPEDAGAEIQEMKTEAGFEAFITHIHKTIERVGVGGFYVFDSMSAIAEDFYSDRMIGNFFQLTCPYLYVLKTVAYFPILRNYHSYHAISPISETTQLLLDVYRHRGNLYVYPLKVAARYSPTMYMLHEWEGERFRPVTESIHVSDVLTTAPWPGLKSASYRMVGVWDRRFMHSEEVLDAYRRGETSREQYELVFQRLIRLVISRDARVQDLVTRYFDLEDLIYVWKRMIGSGMIGGKSVGMLLAQAILKRTDPRWKTLLEAHDSFFIGSDVFYSFLVLNECWWDRQKQKVPETFLDGLEEIRVRILRGKFPDYIMRRFADMLDYFGQSPIIVRSSSFLEDNFANAFAGKYESVFCVNQGTHEERLEEFLSAVRRIYASTMSGEALTYRAKRGVLDRDEQMALLVQRVSGAPHGRCFYPQIAGVGFSFNPYVWNSQIDPRAGMIRLVFGLGTRAVDRHDDDYTRVVSLSDPEIRPEENFDEVRRYAQRKVDVLDLDQRIHKTCNFYELSKSVDDIPMDLFVTREERHDDDMRFARGGSKSASGALTFDKLLRETEFVSDMRQMLRILQDAYSYPVDIEFTANVLEDGRYLIDLLQCRPFQVRGSDLNALPPVEIRQEDLVMVAYGAVIGESRLTLLDRMVYVVPGEYGVLSNQDRHSIAKLIGRITHLTGEHAADSIMVLGPGRWGTSTPSLGVPVSFGEINTVSAMCEIVTIRDDLVPDVSLGTHFFSDLIEMEMLYTAYFPKKAENFFNSDFFMNAPNRLAEILPDEARWNDVVRVIDAASAGYARFKLHADTLNQKCTVFLER